MDVVLVVPLLALALGVLPMLAFASVLPLPIPGAGST